MGAGSRGGGFGSLELGDEFAVVDLAGAEFGISFTRAARGARKGC
jgi:hypothetical protein